MQISEVTEKVTLNRIDKGRWVKNLIGFLRPVAVLYIGSVVTVFGLNNGSFSIEHFIPNSFTLGGMTLYVLNGALDYINKLGEK